MSIILICGFTLVLLVFAGVGIYFFYNAQNQNSANNSGNDGGSSGVLFWGNSDADDNNDGGDSGGDSGGDGGGGE